MPPQLPTPRTASQPCPAPSEPAPRRRVRRRAGEHDGDAGVDHRQAARGAFTCAPAPAPDRPRRRRRAGRTPARRAPLLAWVPAGSSGSPRRCRAGLAGPSTGPARAGSGGGSARPECGYRVRLGRRVGSGVGCGAGGGGLDGLGSRRRLAVATTIGLVSSGVSAVHRRRRPRPPASRRPRWSRPSRRPRAARLEAPSWWVPRPRAPRPSPPPQGVTLAATLLAAEAEERGQFEVRFLAALTGFVGHGPNSATKHAESGSYAACVPPRETTGSRTHIGGSGSVRVPDGITWSG